MKVEVLRNKDTGEKVIIFHEQIGDICKLNREVYFYVTVNANEIEIPLKELEQQLRNLFTPVSNDEEIYVKQYEMTCKVPENNVHIRRVYLLSIRFVYDKDMGSLTIQFFGVNV